MASRIPKSKPSRPSSQSHHETSHHGDRSREAQIQAALDATVVELGKASKRVEELEKQLAAANTLPVLTIPATPNHPRAAELEAFLRKSIKENAINYTEAHALLNKK